MREISGEIKTTTDGYDRQLVQLLSVMITKHRKLYGKSVHVKQQQIHLYRGTDYWLRNFITNIVNMRFP